MTSNLACAYSISVDSAGVRACGLRAWGHCTHIAAVPTHVAFSSRDGIAKSEKSCGHNLQCCNGILSGRTASAELFQRGAVVSCSVHAFEFDSDLPGTGGQVLKVLTGHILRKLA